MERRKHPKLNLWLRIPWLVCIPVTWLLFRKQWRGLEHIPASGGAIVVANHISYADPASFINFIYDAGRIPRFLAKSSLFDVFLLGRVMRRCACIPVYRGSAEAKDSLRAAVAAVRAGECVVIYPEGTVTRDPDWWPMLAKTGVARLALETDVPVIPVAQWGPQLAVDVYNKRYRLLGRRKPVTVQAGQPVDLSAYRDQPVTGALLREVTDVVMRAVRDQLAEIRGETPPAEFYRRPKPAASAEPA
ncbi:MAG TPA: lysophospholipid acyltransferase family protein [Mycobacteriales bacterium]|nr:lysophospholipid acyltransferase family protein [Mycobacteriales bacterium]